MRKILPIWAVGRGERRTGASMVGRRLVEPPLLGAGRSACLGCLF
ncbi:hypothetical protein Z950_1312 [Sulfitobacter mediterraneus KCTC 32188]|nr:hypothetical protein Z950_1312 [Sulfitobacter mediterraneus KCTC 32188]